MAGGTGRLSPAAHFYVAESLDDVQVRRWREFAASVPWSHYAQDPAWAEIERCRAKAGVRQPFFMWAERHGSICLTALGVRRRLPVPRREFWEFSKGPTVSDSGVLDEWVAWLLANRGRGTARVRLQPPLPLDRGGDEAETILECHGFTRRRAMGLWSTLSVDLSRSEDEILASFRKETRYAIRKSQRGGIEVSVEDTREGWSTLARLQAEVALRAPAPEVTREDVAAISRHWLAGGAGGTVLIARLGGGPLSGAMVIVHRGTAYLPLIPSSRSHGKLRTSHLLVWEAMRWARSRGCGSCDLEGYSLVARPGDPLWGVNEFKRGFAGIDQLSKCVAVHEGVYAPAVVAIAGAARRLEAWYRR